MEYLTTNTGLPAESTAAEVDPNLALLPSKLIGRQICMTSDNKTMTKSTNAIVIIYLCTAIKV